MACSFIPLAVFGGGSHPFIANIATGLLSLDQGFLVAALYGRDEDDSAMALCQRDVDEGLQMCLILTDGRTQIIPRPEWSEVILNYSVSE